MCIRDSVLEARAGFAAALHAKREQAGRLAAQVLAHQRVVGVIRQAGVVDPLDLGMLAQVAGHLDRVLDDAVDPQRQRLDALQDLERVERRDRRAGVAQQMCIRDRA